MATVTVQERELLDLIDLLTPEEREQPAYEYVAVLAGALRQRNELLRRRSVITQVLVTAGLVVMFVALLLALGG